MAERAKQQMTYVWRVYHRETYHGLYNSGCPALQSFLVGPKNKRLLAHDDRTELAF